jgi:hypothetical protein
MEIYTPEVLIRHWGKEILAVRTDIHMGKVLERKAGTMGGYQCHVKEESHYLLKGSMRLRTTDGDRVVHAPIAWTVPPLTVHQEEALTDCLLFERPDARGPICARARSGRVAVHVEWRRVREAARPRGCVSAESRGL